MVFHFEAERFSVSDVLVDVLYRLKRITIFDIDVGVECFKKEESVGQNPSVVDVIVSYFYSNPSICWLSATIKWVAVGACLSVSKKMSSISFTASSFFDAR